MLLELDQSNLLVVIDVGDHIMVMDFVGLQPMVMREQVRRLLAGEELLETNYLTNERDDGDVVQKRRRKMSKPKQKKAIKPEPLFEIVQSKLIHESHVVDVK